MVAFASLFLGLLVGVLPVSVLVGDQVAVVTYELDGREVGRVQRKPWTLNVDFGREVAPHELVARAYDRDGLEIGMARQWLNLPRALAEAEFVLERDAEGKPRAARLVWASLLGPDPTRLRVTFDGRELALDGQRRVELPFYDHHLTHILSAELEFPLNLRSRADVVLGGGSAGEASSELTAVPVLLEGSEKLPLPAGLQGWFTARGRELRVVAVEDGPASVILVRHPSNDGAVERFGRRPPSSGPAGMSRDFTALETRLEKKDRVNVLWPVARRFQASNAVAELFDMSREYTAREGGFLWFMTRLYLPMPAPAPLRFADAVAVAGLQAYGGCSRRAVVLVLEESAKDDSRYAPDAVRRYLGKIHVPLYVWSLGQPPGDSPWGAVEDVSTLGKLRKAVSRLRKDLDVQQVVWLEGRHLPQEIRTTERARGISLLP
ncbi:MAG: hypothetical protein ABR576_05270 [Thermoanaerobaculia bacterium]